MNASLRKFILNDTLSARMLTGLSGANIYIATRDNKSWFVRKVAGDPDGNVRLQLQVKKQRQWNEQIGGVIRTPEILVDGDIDGHYYVDMEYIRGEDGASYLQRASYSDVFTFTDGLCQYFRTASKLPPLLKTTDRDNLVRLLYAKISDIQSKTHSVSYKTIAKLFLALEKLPADRTVKPTFCHGDMTLDNIIVDYSGRIYAIDLLNPPLEHYWFDLAKLHQDMEGAWFTRKGIVVPHCTRRYISDALLNVAKQIDPLYDRVHLVLLTITFLRILPYACSEQDIDFIQKRIDTFVSMLE
jgi:aminoglycoside phosphotransferase